MGSVPVAMLLSTLDSMKYLPRLSMSVAAGLSVGSHGMPCQMVFGIQKRPGYHLVG